MKADTNKKQAPRRLCPRCGLVQMVTVGKANPGSITLSECFFCGQREATGKVEEKGHVQGWLDGQKLRPLE